VNSKKDKSKGISTKIYVEPTTELGRQIVELRKQGWSYKQISEKLSCAKATVSYYCGINQKEHKQNYTKNIYDLAIRSFSKRVTAFKNRKPRIRKNRQKFPDAEISFRARVSFF